MIQNVLTHIGGIGIYGVISICLFFAVFVAVVVRVCRLKQPFLNSMSRLPLEDEPEPAPVSPSEPQPHSSHD